MESASLKASEEKKLIGRLATDQGVFDQAMEMLVSLPRYPYFAQAKDLNFDLKTKTPELRVLHKMLRTRGYLVSDGYCSERGQKGGILGFWIDHDSWDRCKVSGNMYWKAVHVI